MFYTAVRAFRRTQGPPASACARACVYVCIVLSSDWFQSHTFIHRRHARPTANTHVHTLRAARRRRVREPRAKSRRNPVGPASEWKTVLSVVDVAGGVVAKKQEKKKKEEEKK